jgi:hypothetical protein
MGACLKNYYPITFEKLNLKKKMFSRALSVEKKKCGKVIDSIRSATSGG